VVGYIDGGGTFQANEIDVSNNGNCGQNGGYGNGQYGTGYYNGANGGACAYKGNRGRHRGHGRHDNDDRDGRDNNNNQGYGNPYPYPTPPSRLP
jgi:hypothetical protein